MHDETGNPFKLKQIPLWRALQGESVRDAPMIISPKNGEARLLIANADPIYDAIGTQSSAVVLMRDVTALKASETELRNIKNLLENQVAAHIVDLERSPKNMSAYHGKNTSPRTSVFKLTQQCR